MAGSMVGPGAGDAEAAAVGETAGIGVAEPAANAGRAGLVPASANAIKTTVPRNDLAITRSYPTRNAGNLWPSLGL